MQRKIMILSMVMAFIAAAVYALMAFDIMIPDIAETPGEISTPEESASTIFLLIPAACYIIGGTLILLKKRWLWITGAIINIFSIIVFYAMYSDQPDVMFSAAGLISKISQMLLEIGLIYLIVTCKKKKPD